MDASHLLPPDPHWLHLLEPHWQNWREHQFIKGRNPDSYIEEKLREDGRWPPANA
jgi:hypothetical protein